MSQRYLVPPYIQYSAVDEEVMLLDERTETYLCLNPTAAVVWTVLVNGDYLEAAVSALVEATAAKQETVLADVHVLLNDLVERGLLTSIQE